jgi:hypothetical protein
VKVLNIERKHYGEDNIQLATTLDKLCRTLYKLREYEKAIEGY